VFRSFNQGIGECCYNIEGFWLQALWWNSTGAWIKLEVLVVINSRLEPIVGDGGPMKL
jgi:hypothetical protein